MFRIQPNLPVESVQTYSIAAPVQTHYRPGSCAEADCPNMQAGWRTVIDETSDLGQRQAHYIRKEAGRRYAETRDEAGLTTFEFPAGQSCFTQHQISLERPALFLMRGGDWRGNPRGERQKFDRPDQWVDTFATHQQALADRLERG